LTETGHPAPILDVATGAGSVVEEGAKTGIDDRWRCDEDSVKIGVAMTVESGFLGTESWGNL
jgi:hypothetical protein